jgi:hypothetical protein
MEAARAREECEVPGGYFLHVDMDSLGGAKKLGLGLQLSWCHGRASCFCGCAAVEYHTCWVHLADSSCNVTSKERWEGILRKVLSGSPL